ncbi:calcium channel regulatory subunit Yam8 [Schizosaccharomyces cryophilus OY26]|uniref:Calcium channel regulatory subunit Yam8 n=1 Tax=Schizosaccharomyces cryophilus (strain OY26 / ATCC MYA-4695 / CBS 11777 / NBRC 106824 / NRRL Y48691) TaxID=653667 RepID=S9W2K1_SCHCR|nr:calcium channel regulatory subunit Yam8 [Schizosaccharomyces cryophilus OY26]EPY52664.1 calcium channel regulatory subunit Yam8 [Schizosaccharomyces cryophilus OY26]
MIKIPFILLLFFAFVCFLATNIAAISYNSLSLNGTVVGSIEDQSVVYYNLSWPGGQAATINLTLSTCSTYEGSSSLILYASNYSFDNSLALGNYSYSLTDLGLTSLSVTGYSPMFIAVSSSDSQYSKSYIGNNRDTSSNSAYQTQYELSAGNNFTFTQYNEAKFLYAQDTDFQAALLITGNLTTNDTSVIPNYEIFVNPTYSTFDKQIGKLSNSFCAYRSNPSTLNINNADLSMTVRGLGPFAKEQFYLKGLSPNTSYTAYLVKPNANASGGTTYPPITFTTKVGTTCQLIYDLEFCSEVAYSVPGNSASYSALSLASWYDQQAFGYYKNFTYTLDQYPCNATALSIYSLLRNCSDCLHSYKNWLCAAIIPRCADITDNSTFLVYRNNNSRYPLIDHVIRPGPYKEVLPCSHLCYTLASSCPADLGLACPDHGYGLEESYGDISNATGVISCNAPGVEFYESVASLLQKPWLSFLILFLTWSLVL